MKTKIIKINKNNLNKLKIAAKLIENSEIVAFPTETVYGLGANAFDIKGINKIFIAKNRPKDNPLIVHISNINQIREIAKEIPKKANLLIDKFFPGPLTIVLKKNKKISKSVTAGLNSVAIRMPENKIALKLIKFANVPIAAPSANSSGRPSPTIAKHVIEDLDGKIPMIIDGGKCKVGIESTVIDLTSSIPTILRPGIITKKQIEKVIGKVNILIKNNKKVNSPGLRHKHYSPKVPLIIINESQIKEKLKERNIIILSFKKIKSNNVKYIGDNYKIASKNFFELLRIYEKTKKVIYITKPKKSDEWKGLYNRLSRACEK